MMKKRLFILWLLSCWWGNMKSQTQGNNMSQARLTCTSSPVSLSSTTISNYDYDVNTQLFFDDFGISDLSVEKGRVRTPYMPANSFKFGRAISPANPYPNNGPCVFADGIEKLDQARITDGYYAVVAPLGNSELLSFPKTTATNALTDTRTDNDRGIILPAVDTRPSFVNKASNNGTFIFDKSSKKVLMFENGIWKELSQGSGDIGSLVLNTSAEEGNGVVIGADATSAEGVLVLESNNKALVLPHIENPHITVKSPYPGMICYDTKSNSLAIFDGAKWNYWR